MYNPEEFPLGPGRPPLAPLSAMGWLIEARCHPQLRAALPAECEAPESGASESASTTVGANRWLGRLVGFLGLWMPQRTAATAGPKSP